nr:HSPC049 [Homo sapiens]
MAEAVERTDELVREYLLFRGFTHTLRQLDAEIKADKEKGFRVDKIVDQLQQLMQVYDLAALRDYWSYLERRLFSRLEDIYRPTIHKLKTSLFRFYLVYTIQTNRNDKAQEFFAKQATELQNQAEWKDWFVLPFLPSRTPTPPLLPTFLDSGLTPSLCPCTLPERLFQCMPVPVILNFDAECQRTNQVQEENEVLRQKLFALQAEIHRLKKEEQQPEEEEALVQHKLPPYVSNMDRLGDSELAMVCSQRNASLSQSLRVGFLSSLLPQSKKSPSRLSPAQGPPQPQSSAKKESFGGQGTKGKDPTSGAKDGKSLLSGLATGESGWSQHRQRRLQDHGKERKELFSTTTSQCAEKKPEASGPEAEPCPELHTEPVEPLTRASRQALRVEESARAALYCAGQEEYGNTTHPSCTAEWIALGGESQLRRRWGHQSVVLQPHHARPKHLHFKSPLLSLNGHQTDRLLLLGSGVGTVRLYDTEAKKNLCEININDNMPRILSLRAAQRGSLVCSAAAPSLTSQVDFSAPDIGSKGMNQVPGRLLLWDTKTMKQQLQFSLDPEPIAINCTAFNHNGNLLVTGAADGVIRLFDMQQHECAMSWRAHYGRSTLWSSAMMRTPCTASARTEVHPVEHPQEWPQGIRVQPPSDATGPFVLSGYSGYKQVQVPRGRLFAFDSEGNYMLTCSATGGVIYKLGGDEKVLESCLKLGGHRALWSPWTGALPWTVGPASPPPWMAKIKLTTLLAHKA